jgi:mlo protein
MKKVIFEEQTADALQRWQKNAKKKVKRQRKSDHPSSGLASRSVLSSGVQSGETTPTQGSSPLHLLRRYKTMGDINTPDISERYYHSEYEASELKMDASPSYPPQRTESILITQAQATHRPQDSILRQKM